MTRFDLHTHIGTDPLGIPVENVSFTYMLKNLSKVLTKNNIDHAINFPMPYYSRSGYELSGENVDNIPYFLENIHIIDGASEDKRIIPFISVSTKSKESLRCAEYFLDNGGKGVKFHGNAFWDNILSLQNFGFMDMIEKKDVPVVVHTDHIRGTMAPDYHYFADPMDLLNLARKYPKVRFLSAHSGLFSERYIDALKEVDNVWTDASPINYLCSTKTFKAQDRIAADYNSPTDVLEKLYKRLKEKLVFGSDSPYHLTCKARYKDEVSVVESLGEEIAGKIFDDNPRRFLKM
jgi:predicted TIM-barrel fold metal-dependent hydrolase